MSKVDIDKLFEIEATSEIKITIYECSSGTVTVQDFNHVIKSLCLELEASRVVVEAAKKVVDSNGDLYYLKHLKMALEELDGSEK